MFTGALYFVSKGFSLDFYIVFKCTYLLNSSSFADEDISVRSSFPLGTFQKGRRKGTLMALFKK